MSQRQRWDALSWEQKRRLVQAYDLYRWLAPADRARVRGRMKRLGELQSELREHLRRADPQELRRLESLPDREKRMEFDRLTRKDLRDGLTSLRGVLPTEDLRAIEVLDPAARALEIRRSMKAQLVKRDREMLEVLLRREVIATEEYSELRSLPPRLLRQKVKYHRKAMLLERLQRHIASGKVPPSVGHWLEGLPPERFFSQFRRVRERFSTPGGSKSRRGS